MTDNTMHLPTVYIGDKFTLDGTEVTVTDTLGIENMGGGLVGVVVKVLSDDVHIDPSAMAPRTRIVAGDDMYPTGRVDEAIDYLKATRAHVYAGHVAMYTDHADLVPNEVLDVIDEVLDRLGVPGVETEEVRPWGINNVPSSVHVDVPSSVRTTLARVTRADEVVLHLDGMSFVTNGNEVEWIGADCIDNLQINTTTYMARLWPSDDPHRLGNPRVETNTYATTVVKWDAVYNDGAYVDPGRVVMVNHAIPAQGVTDDHMSRAEYAVTMSRETKYTDIDTVLTRDEFTADTAEEDEDNGN